MPAAGLCAAELGVGPLADGCVTTAGAGELDALLPAAPAPTLGTEGPGELDAAGAKVGLLPSAAGGFCTTGEGFFAGGGGDAGPPPPLPGADRLERAAEASLHDCTSSGGTRAAMAGSSVANARTALRSVVQSTLGASPTHFCPPAPMALSTVRATCASSSGLHFEPSFEATWTKSSKGHATESGISSGRASLCEARSRVKMATKTASSTLMSLSLLPRLAQLPRASARLRRCSSKQRVSTSATAGMGAGVGPRSSSAHSFRT
mmetsp:Transcript_15751/g.37000  ORF Transcript_15751/g.37000 Transcript_15751/m.37000 type:complete len:263 (-) Transcript_15751:1187-1975(-)